MLGEKFKLSLTQNIDILSSLNKEGIVTVAFKAEMDEENAVANASKMIDAKNIDAVCLNILKDSSSFGTDENKIEFIKAGNIESIPQADKLSLSFEILNHAKDL